MGTSAGPSLQGIGRGGASNLVLEMDAHDAKSYPGEPTLNVMKNGYFPGTDTTTTSSGWAINGTAGIVTFRGGGEEFFYQGLGLSNPRVLKFNGVGWYNDTNSGYIVQSPIPLVTSTVYAISFWYRFTGENVAQLSNQIIKLDFDGGLTDPGDVAYSVYNDTEWHHHSVLKTSSTTTFTAYIYGNHYSICSGGAYFEIAGFQVEAKGYSTPFVGEGQFARPASVNLMIHGDVGTGSSFEDSSPEKHTVTTVNGATHSGTSKFGGTAIYGGNGYASGNRIEVAGSDVGTFGTGDFTVDFWMKSDGSQTTRSDVVALYDPGWAENFTFDFNDGSYGIWFFWNSSGSPYIRGLADGFCTDGEWHHVAAVRYGTTVNLFIDGTSVGTNTESGTMGGAGTDDWLISNWGGGLYGWVDEMRICVGTALWTAAFTPPTRRNLSAPVVDRSGSDNGGNFATTDMTDVSIYRVGEVIRPIDSAVWDFDGTDDVITLGPSGGLGITDTVSVFAWIKLDNLSGWDGVFGAYDGGAFIHFQMYLGGVNCYLYGPNPSYNATDSESYVSAGEWAQVGFTFGDDILRVYVDGEQMPTTVAGNGNPITTTSEVSIGRVYSSGRMFNGEMGNVQVYNALLTAQQVKENFNQQRNRFKV